MSIYTENKLLSTYKRESGKSSHYDYKLLEKILNKYRVKNHNVNYVRAVKFEFEYMIIIITYEFGDMSRDELSDNEIRQIFEKKTLQYHNISWLIARGVLKKPTYQRDIDDRRVNIISNYIISNFDKPSFTIPARIWRDGYDALVKYNDNEIRKLTILELKRIQSFPDNYILEGSKKDVIMQIGNAVACKFAYHLGKHIINTLNA